MERNFLSDMSNKIDDILKSKEFKESQQKLKSNSVKPANQKPDEKPNHGLGNKGSTTNTDSSNGRSVKPGGQPQHTPGKKR